LNMPIYTMDVMEKVIGFGVWSEKVIGFEEWSGRGIYACSTKQSL